MHYRAAPNGALSFRQLDSLTAIFDRRSRQTHIVASPVPEILAVMGQGQWSVAALAQELATQFDVAEAESDLVLSLIARLDELAALGLVEPL